MRYLLIVIFFTMNWVHAEIVTDGSVGARVALPGNNYQITPELGQQLGGNLFHSFDKFNLSSEESATFSGADSVQNIISRVTGDAASNIDGTLRSTVPNADLYLINPKGILFGKNTKLELQGGFHASTADTLRLGTDGSFNAKNPAESILTSAPPAAFGFLTDSPAALQSEGAQLVVNTGKTLSLIAGDISLGLYRSGNQAQLTKPSAINGRVNLTSSRGPGEVIMKSDDIVMETLPGEIKLQSVQLSSYDGGSVYIRAGEFILANSLIGMLNGTKSGGKLDIKARNVSLTQGSKISTTSLIATASDISIQAEDTISVTGQDAKNAGSYIASDTKSSKNGGNINLQARRLEFKDGGKLGASSRAAGNGGKIQIDATEEVLFDGEDANSPSSIYLIAASSGKGGTLVLNAGKLTLSNGTYLGADTTGSGAGGNISINTQETVLKGVYSKGSGSFISSNTLSTDNNAGSGGEINIKTQNLSLTDGGQVTTSTLGQGAGGIVHLEANQVNISGQSSKHSGIFSVATAEATGHAGQISVITQDLRLSDSGEINAGTRGQGMGGDVNVETQRADINGGRITALSTGTGNAGSVTLKVHENLLLNDSAIETKTEAAAGGNLFISVPHMLYLWNSNITTSVHGGVGNGGNITIDQPKFVILNNAKTVAQADAGRGGDINIISQEFLRSTESLVSASSRLGIDGNVFISAPDADLSGDLIVLNSDFLNADALLKTPCSQIDSENLGSLVVAQREGIPNYQDDLQASTPLFTAIVPTEISLSASGTPHKTRNFKSTCSLTLDTV